MSARTNLLAAHASSRPLALKCLNWQGLNEFSLNTDINVFCLGLTCARVLSAPGWWWNKWLLIFSMGLYICHNSVTTVHFARARTEFCGENICFAKKKVFWAHENNFAFKISFWMCADLLFCACNVSLACSPDARSQCSLMLTARLLNTTQRYNVP